MRKRASALFLTGLIIMLPAANARSSFGDGTSIDLALACQAATTVFNSRNEKRLLASQRTSLSDALRAGYCLGALELYSCPRHSNTVRSSFDAARRIAELDVSLFDLLETNVQDLLQYGACH
jgi:hypothetical protein